jgi:hypothetical protein
LGSDPVVELTLACLAAVVLRIRGVVRHSRSLSVSVFVVASVVEFVLVDAPAGVAAGVVASEIYPMDRYAEVGGRMELLGNGPVGVGWTMRRHGLVFDTT